jgi:hypothetical protein
MRQRLHVQEHSLVRQYADCLTWQRPGVQDWAAGSHQLAVMRAYAEPESGCILYQLPLKLTGMSPLPETDRHDA